MRSDGVVGLASLPDDDLASFELQKIAWLRKSSLSSTAMFLRLGKPPAQIIPVSATLQSGEAGSRSILH
jgi:hypothetical protein